jgi:hypothetical protein
LGYSNEEVELFLNMLHELQLPPLEISKEINTFDQLFNDKFQWKISFVEEWEKIWELDRKGSGNYGAYDDVVEDPKLTMDDPGFVNDNYLSDDGRYDEICYI